MWLAGGLGDSRPGDTPARGRQIGRTVRRLGRRDSLGAGRSQQHQPGAHGHRHSDQACSHSWTLDLPCTNYGFITFLQLTF